MSKKSERLPNPEREVAIPAYLDQIAKEFSGEETLDEGSDDGIDALSLRQRKFIEVFIATLGNVTKTARIINVTERTIYRWLADSEIQKTLNTRKLSWELELSSRAMELALHGDRILIMFILKFLNPFYDDQFRSRVLAGEVQSTLYDRHPIPNPEFLPPEIPERFLDGQSPGAGSEGAEAVSTTLVHVRSDK